MCGRRRLACFSRLPRKCVACRPALPRAMSGIVDPLVVQLVVGDRVVLDAGVDAVPLGVDVGLDVVHRQVEADVAVEVAVVLVARVALLRAPDLLRRFDVAPERRDAAGAVDRRVGAVDRAAIGEQDAVGVDEEVADRRLAQQLVDAGDVAALAQPHAARAVAEVLFVQIGGDVDLGADVGPVAIHQREEGVRRRRGDHLDATRLLQQVERAPDRRRGSARCGAATGNGRGTCAPAGGSAARGACVRSPFRPARSACPGTRRSAPSADRRSAS